MHCSAFIIRFSMKLWIIEQFHSHFIRNSYSRIKNCNCSRLVCAWSHKISKTIETQREKGVALCSCGKGENSCWYFCEKLLPKQIQVLHFVFSIQKQNHVFDKPTDSFFVATKLNEVVCAFVLCDLHHCFSKVFTQLELSIVSNPNIV